MNTLLFINANSCDVEIFKSICCMLITVTAIIAGCSVLATGLKALFDWMKCMEIGKNPKKADEGNSPNPDEEKRKYELQKQDRAKALVKDFYEATKDKEQKKDLDTAEKLLKLYEKIMGYNAKGTDHGEEK